MGDCGNRAKSAAAARSRLLVGDAVDGIRIPWRTYCLT
jgi:hypothetical protein